MNRHAASYTAYPRGDSGTFSISPHKFQPRSHHGPRRRIQYIKYLVIAVCSIFTLSFLFPSFRSAASLGLYSHPETFPVETIRYYDLSDVQGTAKGWDREERVLLCTPLRDAEPHLRMFFSHLRNFTYPHHMIDLAFLVSDSKDNTMGLLTDLLHGLQDDPDPKMPYGEISVIGKDFGQKVNQDVESRHGFAAQAGRRKLMAQARNWLLSAALRPYHSWVYWRDADVETCPFTILEDLMRHNKDVIVPNVWRPLPDWLGGEQPYDLNSWQESETALALADTLDEDAVIVEGYAEYATWRPHLAYLRDPYGDPDMEMELDGVGGVSILAKAKVFRSGVHFPAFSFEKHAETEGFGKMAKRMKFTVTGLPHYTIWHLYEPSVDDIRHMEEMEAERKVRENEEKERTERMKKIKEEYKDTNSQWETDKKDIQNIAMKEKEQKHAEKLAEMEKKPARPAKEKPAGQPAAAQPAKEKLEETQTKEQLAKNAALKEQASKHKVTKPKATEDDEDTEPTKHKVTKPKVADDDDDTGTTKLKAAKAKPKVTEGNDEDTELIDQKPIKSKLKVTEDDEDAEPEVDEDAEPKEMYSNAKTIPGTESKVKSISEHDSKIKAAAAQDPNVKKDAAEKYAKAKAATEKEET